MDYLILSGAVAKPLNPVSTQRIPDRDPQEAFATASLTKKPPTVGSRLSEMEHAGFSYHILRFLLTFHGMRSLYGAETEPWEADGRGQTHSRQRSTEFIEFPPRVELRSSKDQGN